MAIFALTRSAVRAGLSQRSFSVFLLHLFLHVMVSGAVFVERVFPHEEPGLRENLL